MDELYLNIQIVGIFEGDEIIDIAKRIHDEILDAYGSNKRWLHLQMQRPVPREDDPQDEEFPDGRRLYLKK